GDTEGMADQRVEPGPDRLAGLGEGEGVLDLPEDLRLADHHRVEAGRYAERMANGLGIDVRVEQRLHAGQVDPAMPAQVTEGQRARLPRRLGHAVHLHP